MAGAGDDARLHERGGAAQLPLVSQDIEMDDDDRFTSDAAVEFQDVDGNVVANLCATAWGTRFE